MTPLFALPEDEIRTERINLPNGKYQADFTSAEIASNDAGWRAIRANFANFSLPDGSTQVSTTFRGNEVTIDLTQRTHRAQYTAESTSEQAREIGAREIVRLAVALGAATNGDGTATVPGETLEEVVETLNQYAGRRVNVSIRNRPRKRQKVVQTNERGEPIVDDELSSVWALETD